MSLRDKPRLSDRLRGKSSNELINEIKKEFEKNKKAWFDANSSGLNPFSTEGFPFEVDTFTQKSDAGIKSHLEDLANKHPEFASDLRCPPWGGSVNKNWENAYTVPVSVEKSEVHDLGASTSSNNHLQSTCRNNLYQPNLRNTVDIVENIPEVDSKIPKEIKRSSSAPPDPSINHSVMNKKEPQRFTSKIEITPVNPFEENSLNSSGSKEDAVSAEEQTSLNTKKLPIIIDRTFYNDPAMEPANVNKEVSATSCEKAVNVDVNPQSHEHKSPQVNRKQPQVHHIPIFVEGRKEPVISQNIDSSSKEKNVKLDQSPLKRKLDINNTDSLLTSNNTPPNLGQVPPEQKQVSSEELNATTSQPAQALKPSLLQQVQNIQQEVDNLTILIEQYNGSSRTDKVYLYLDEMLTRNLIKLDIIEVDGNEQLRSARKEVIKSIQKSIALLESKVPVMNIVPSNDNANANTESSPKDTSGNGDSNDMEVDESKVIKSNESIAKDN